MTPIEYLKWMTDNIALVSVILFSVVTLIVYYFFRKDKNNPAKNDYVFEEKKDKQNLEQLTHTISDDITIDVEESYARAQNFEQQCKDKIDHIQKKKATVHVLLNILKNKLNDLETAEQLEQARIMMIQDARNKRIQSQNQR